MKMYQILLMALVSLSFSCERVAPSYIGVLITDCGQDGLKDYKVVQGKVNTMGVCTELVQVPSFEQKGDLEPFTVTTRDGGTFTVDPYYNYQAIREKAPLIVYNYQQFKGDEAGFLEGVETNVLNPRIKNVYLETARNFTTDSLMRNMNLYEKMVEKILTVQFKTGYFDLLTLTSGLTPPKSMQEAIQRRNQVNIQAEENRLALQRDKAQLELTLQKAQMAVEVARLEMEANKLRAQGLSEPVLREMFIKGWIEKGCPMPQVLGQGAVITDITKQ